MPAKTQDRFRQIETKPTLAGDLITRASLEICALNYSVKRDFRRDLDQDIRREGCDYFAPKTDIAIGSQPFPGQILLDKLECAAGVATATRYQGQWFGAGEHIIIAGASDSIYNGTHLITSATATTFQFSVSGAPVSPDASTAITATPIETISLIAMARRPNGQVAAIAGSKRRLYRFYALEESDYISRDPADYPSGTAADQLSYWSDGYYFVGDSVDYPAGTPVRQQQYVDTIDQGIWIVIGSGFSSEGKRWETVNINGYMVFNNSVDLLCTYRVEDLEVVPIYELREQGISCVGTISEINGILMCADISEIPVEDVADWFNTASDPYGRYTGEVNRTQFRVAWSIPGEPRRFGAIIPGTINAGSNSLLLDYEVSSLRPGDEITIVGAGAPFAGGTSDNLDATIIFIHDKTVIIDAFAGTSVTSALVQRTDALGSIVGYEDLQDDGSAILKMMPIADTLVIFKESSVFLGTYLGDVNQPFVFAPRRIQKEQSLYYRNTLALAQTSTEMFLIYAGRNAFYRFDLTNQQPMLLPKFEACHNLFFDVATLDNTEVIFAAENGITHEILFVFGLAEQTIDFEGDIVIGGGVGSGGGSGSAGPIDEGDNIYGIGGEGGGEEIEDHMLLWDYKQDTISTSSLPITAAATIRKPITGIALGAEEDWFVMGTAEGSVSLYGLTNEAQSFSGWASGKAIWFRRYHNPYDSSQEEYTSVLKSGLAHYGIDYSEKDIRYLLLLLGSQSPDTECSLSLYGCQNNTITPDLLGTQVFTNIGYRNLMPVMFRKFLFQTELLVEGKNNPFRYIGLVHSVAAVDSRSAPRK